MNRVDCEGSHAGYRDMELFIGTVNDAERADRLDIAVQGRGAFRRFKDGLARWVRRARPLVLVLRGTRAGRTHVWLADAGYRVATVGEQGYRMS